MARAHSYWYRNYMDSANSTNPTGWTSTVSGNYSYTEFIDRVIYDKLSNVEKELEYYMGKLADKVDEELISLIKDPEVKSCPEFMKSAQLFDPENLWSEPLCLKLKNAQSVAQK